MASEAKPMVSISSPSQGCFLMAQIMLRILAFALSLGATIVLMTGKQSVVLFITISARYNYASAYKFLAGVDIAVCGLSVLSLIFVCLIGRAGSNLKNYFFLFLIDLVTMLLMVSGCAAATAIGYVAELGQEKMGWVAVCDTVGKFCHLVIISLVLSYLTFFSNLALTVMSANKLMSS